MILLVSFISDQIVLLGVIIQLWCRGPNCKVIDPCIYSSLGLGFVVGSL